MERGDRAEAAVRGMVSVMSWTPRPLDSFVGSSFAANVWFGGLLSFRPSTLFYPVLFLLSFILPVAANEEQTTTRFGRYTLTKGNESALCREVGNQVAEYGRVDLPKSYQVEMPPTTRKVDHRCDIPIKSAG